MPKASHAILDYATPAPAGGIDRLRSLFWPIAVAFFVAGVVVMAGVGWASAVIQLGTSFALLLVWLAAAYGWGLIPRLILKLPVETPLGRVTTLATGLGILSLLTLGLGLVGGMNQIVAGAITLIGFGVSVVGLLRHRTSVHLRVDLVHWWWLLLAPLASLTITAAMLPAGFLWGMDEPNGYDVVEYHLQVPREWFELGRIVPLTHNVFSFFPFNVEMHYLFAMHLMGGPWVAQFLAQMMHAAFVGLTVAAVYAAVAERGRFAAMMAALFAGAVPWMPMLGSIAYNEGGLLLYGTLGIAWAMRATSWRQFSIAGLMIGFACGCKLTAVPMLLIGLPVSLTLTLLLNRALSRQAMLGMLFMVAIAVLVFSPWLVRNAIWVGNPVFPEQQKLLGRGYFSQEQSDRFYKAHKPRPDQQAFSARTIELWRQVFADWRFAYAPLPIALVAILLTIRRRETQLLLLMLLGLTAFWLIATHLQGRFYVLAIPIAAMAIGGLPRRGVWAVGTLVIIMAVAGTAMTVWRLQQVTDEMSRRGVDLMTAIGFTEIDRSIEIRNNAGVLPNMPIVLIGDAQAYNWKVPSKQLHYRTVFDADTSNGRSASDAWTADLPNGTQAMFYIDLSELERFNRTYGTPRSDLGYDMMNLPGPQFSMVWTVRHLPSQPVPASAPSP